MINNPESLVTKCLLLDVFGSAGFIGSLLPLVLTEGIDNGLLFFPVWGWDRERILKYVSSEVSYVVTGLFDETGSSNPDPEWMNFLRSLQDMGATVVIYDWDRAQTAAEELGAPFISSKKVPGEKLTSAVLQIISAESK